MVSGRQANLVCNVYLLHVNVDFDQVFLVCSLS